VKPLVFYCHVCLLSALAIFGSGCAFSKTPVSVNYTPAYRQPLQAASPSTLHVGEFKDSRPVNDQMVLLHKVNAYGPTSGAWVAQRPVAELMRNAVSDALKANNFNLTESGSGKYELRGDLQEFGFHSIAGFWTAKVKPRMQVRFELVEKTTGHSVWRDTYIGRGDIETAWGTSQTVVSLFKLGTEDVIRQLLSDSTFRKFSEGQPVTVSNR
jgi:hypothetical protein